MFMTLLTCLAKPEPQPVLFRQPGGTGRPRRIHREAATGDSKDDAALLQADTAIGAAATAAGLGPSGSAPGQAGSEAEQADWGCILRTLALDDRQLHYLLLLRERHLDRLQSLAAARQALSLQARLPGDHDIMKAALYRRSSMMHILHRCVFARWH